MTPLLPTLSVVMPNYNHGHFIGAALEAIVGQSRPPDEVIVLDDGSTDDSVRVIQGFVERLPRVRLIRNEQRLGSNRSAMRGLECASGEFVYLAAADDRVLPSFFEKSLGLLALFPKSDLCLADTSLFWEEGGTASRLPVLLADGPGYYGAEDLVELYRTGAIVRLINGASALIRRSALLRAGGLIEGLKWYSDPFNVIVIGFRSGLCYVPEPLTLFRIQASSFSGASIGLGGTDLGVIVHLLEMLQSPSFADVRPRWKRSGVLSCFGASMLRVLLTRSRYREFLSSAVLRRALWHSAKQTLYFLSPRGLRPALHSVAQAFRTLRGSPTGPGTPRSP